MPEARTTITVDAANPTHAVDPLLYGVFFEEINYAGCGGIYAEKIQNRAFMDPHTADAWGEADTTRCEGRFGGGLRLNDGTRNAKVALPVGIVDTLTECTIAAWVNPAKVFPFAKVFDFGNGQTGIVYYNRAGAHMSLALASTQWLGGGSGPGPSFAIPFASTRRPISRRRFLRGAGVALALVFTTWVTTPRVRTPAIFAERGKVFFPQFRDPNAAAALERVGAHAELIVHFVIVIPCLSVQAAIFLVVDPGQLNRALGEIITIWIDSHPLLAPLDAGVSFGSRGTQLPVISLHTKSNVLILVAAPVGSLHVAILVPGLDGLLHGSLGILVTRTVSGHLLGAHCNLLGAIVRLRFGNSRSGTQTELHMLSPAAGPNGSADITTGFCRQAHLLNGLVGVGIAGLLGFSCRFKAARQHRLALSNRVLEHAGRSPQARLFLLFKVVAPAQVTLRQGTMSLFRGFDLHLADTDKVVAFRRGIGVCGLLALGDIGVAGRGLSRNVVAMCSHAPSIVRLEIIRPARACQMAVLGRVLSVGGNGGARIIGAVPLLTANISLRGGGFEARDAARVVRHGPLVMLQVAET